MTWLVLCHDGANAAALRKRYLDRHLAYIESVMDQVAVAGPLAESEDGEYAERHNLRQMETAEQIMKVLKETLIKSRKIRRVWRVGWQGAPKPCGRLHALRRTASALDTYSRRALHGAKNRGLLSWR